MRVAACGDVDVWKNLIVKIHERVIHSIYASPQRGRRFARKSNAGGLSQIRVRCATLPTQRPRAATDRSFLKRNVLSSGLIVRVRQPMISKPGQGSSQLLLVILIPESLRSSYC